MSEASETATIIGLFDRAMAEAVGPLPVGPLESSWRQRFYRLLRGRWSDEVAEERIAIADESMRRGDIILQRARARDLIS